MVVPGVIRRSLRALTAAALPLTLAACATGPQVTPQATLEPLPASFTGMLPCADCPGIDYRLNLFADHSFFLRRHYRDSDEGTFDAIGRWTRDGEGRLVLRSGGDMAPANYLVLDDARALEQLDREGARIDSELNYRLTRSEAFQPFAPALGLAGMYRYVADAPLLRECLTGRRFPVRGGAGNVALERAYRQSGVEPGAPVKITMRGRIERQAAMEGSGRETVVVVEALEGVWPGESCGSPFADAALTNTRWRVTRLDGQPVTVPDDGEAPHLRLHPDDSRVTGFAGCNRVMGRYDLGDDGNLRFPQLASTLMACPATGAQEQRLMRALETVTRFEIDGSHLMLRDDQGATRVYLEATHL